MRDERNGIMAVLDLLVYINLRVMHKYPDRSWPSSWGREELLIAAPGILFSFFTCRFDMDNDFAVQSTEICTAHPKKVHKSLQCQLAKSYCKVYRSH